MNKAITKRVSIGTGVLYKGEKYYVQDVNVLSQMAKIAIPDWNGICLDWFWISWKDLDVIE